MTNTELAHDLLKPVRLKGGCTIGSQIINVKDAADLVGLTPKQLVDALNDDGVATKGKYQAEWATAKDAPPADDDWKAPLLATLSAYIAPDDATIPRREFLSLVADRIHDDILHVAEPPTAQND